MFKNTKHVTLQLEEVKKKETRKEAKLNLL